MKKILLKLIIILSFAITAHSQTLQNTWWRAYDSQNMPDAYAHFAQDTLFGSNSNITYFHVATFTTNGNLFTITNTTFWNCISSYAGNYSFTIQNDTLQFSLVSDTCSQRIIAFTTYYFVRLLTGIEDINSISTAIVYPNPSADGIYNITFNDNNLPDRMYVLSTDGRKILDDNFVEGNHTINLQSSAPGIYLLVMENKSGRKTIKLIR